VSDHTSNHVKIEGPVRPRASLNSAELFSQESIPSEYLVESVRIGYALLGNWGLPERDDPHFAVRSLNGSFSKEWRCPTQREVRSPEFRIKTR